ncbi:YbbR family protein [Deinococcus proteolyticus MRP]|uniref:YbbR family protein n=1 Tax=Deinococcus proteolyticus (strain ATCC 35074 / DSM 20540 / JCM 6276 / NBRC 101906 / NCIMB 13154 / VKM Ac-1939 / CCM 2703 / MRP) TaxID=693977 RepID=F0RNS5_DEIPM|nr:CdaR family protein [Deinococcus proteolyticus]ADY25308.1 YbbR family protein [Deinococcus proteolyticus MRP]
MSAPRTPRSTEAQPQGHALRRPQTREQMRRGLGHDWAAKLLALLAAFVLWFFASEDRRAIIDQTYDVPVNVRDNTDENAAETRAVTGLSPGTIKVTLSGRPERLRELRGEMIEAVVNVTDIAEGSFNQPLTVTAPGGTEVVRVTPDRVQGVVDTVQTRSLPVTVTVYAPDSTLMPRYQAQPAEVTVSGPSRAVNEVEQVIYAPVELQPGETRSVTLLPLDGDGQPVTDLTLSPATVRLTRAASDGQPSTALPVRLAPPPGGLQLTSARLSPEQVRVIGPADALEGLTELVGTAEYRTGSYQTEVRFEPPSGVQVLDRVTAQLEVRPQAAGTASPVTTTELFQSVP